MDDAATSPAGSNLRAHVSCAIYARTSRESEAGLTYSSIEAQQDACCAYLHKPQSLGQPAVPPSPVPPPRLYADEGLSGATLQRPALQHLLADIAAGLIDVVVVYKIDRLSRSLTQFSRLMQIFDRHSVQLLSVSQHLDSQHAEGRLVINTLMAFAQFERELTGERQLDKIRATRRHGLWTGGTAPLGYDTRGQRLCVNRTEANVAVKLFERFVALRSATSLVAELASQGITTKSWVTRAGKPRGGLPIDKNYLYKLLNNRTLLGEIKSGAQWVPGLHEPIIKTDLWEQAHALLNARRRPRKRAPLERSNSFLLAGLVFGTDGRAYSAWRSSVRRGRAYAYYVPQARIAAGAASTALPRCHAFQLETVVVEQLRRRLREPGYALGVLTAAGKAHPLFSPAAVEHALMNIDYVWPLLFTQVKRDFLHKVIERVVVGTDGISITISAEGLSRTLQDVIQGNSAAVKAQPMRNRVDPAQRR